ncbi:hypothetical protein COOONC_18019 [Cooperia oncophora]
MESTCWKVRRQVIQPATGKEQHRMFSVKEFISSTHRITYQQMVSMLRCECVQVDDDSFEYLGHSPPEGLPSIPSGVKCVVVAVIALIKVVWRGSTKWTISGCADNACTNRRSIKSVWTAHPSTSR